MKVRFHTNLDEPQRFIDELNLEWLNEHIPRMGERVRIYFPRDGERYRYSFELEVVGVVYDRGLSPHAKIELHIPSWQRSMSVPEWSDWFKRYLRGDGA